MMKEKQKINEIERRWFIPLGAIFLLIALFYASFGFYYSTFAEINHRFGQNHNSQELKSK